MSNMGYCKFENTAQDLQQCIDDWELDEDDTDFEKRGKENIIKLAKRILDMEGYNVEKE